MNETRRLYYENAYVAGNEARVLESGEYKLSGADGLKIVKTEVVLDSTCFYPEGGGQPSDRGFINGYAVECVYERKAETGGSRIVHRLSSAAAITPGDKAVCELDFKYRFSNMQDHTSQHILSEAFIRTSALNTVSMHMGEEYMTIDLIADKSCSVFDFKNFKIAKEAIDEAETLANSIIHKNLKISSQSVPFAELYKYRLRKIPELKEDTVRLVTIEDYDNSLCCGTHLAFTGEAGVIKIIGQQKANNAVRIKFVNGMKALLDYRRKNNIIYETANFMSCDYKDLLNAVEKLVLENKTLAKKKNELFGRYCEIIAGGIGRGLYLENGIYWPEPGDVPYAGLSIMASILSRASGSFAFVLIDNSCGASFRFIIGKTASYERDIKKLFDSIVEVFNIKGGGSSLIVQGGSIDVSRAGEFEKIVKAALMS